MPNVVQTKEIREAILDATDRLLSVYGYKKMTIDDLAREVGIGKGSIYLHFASKEDIVLSHIDRIVERVKFQLGKIAASDCNSSECLRQMLAARITIRVESVQHYTQNLNDLLADLRPKLLARRRQYFFEEAQIFAEVIEKGQSSGEFCGGDAFQAAEILLLATNSLLPYSLTTRELGERAEIEERANRLADILIKGLKK